MAYSFLITLREGLEAALIIGIVLAYLTKTGHTRYFGSVWMGTAGAIAVSLLGGLAIFFTVGELEGAAEEIFEGSAMLLAVGVLTYMIFWMRQQAVNIKRHLQAKVDSALATGSHLALALLAFTVVVREGIETVLFLFAGAVGEVSPLLYTIGGFLGLAAAVVLGYSLYIGSSRLSLRTFFNVSSAFIIVLAAGLLAQGIHEFQEAGLLPAVVEHLWDIGGVLSDKSDFGRFLVAIFGYDSNPSFVQVIGYWGYLALALWYYFRPAPAPARAELAGVSR